MFTTFTLAEIIKRNSKKHTDKHVDIMGTDSALSSAQYYIEHKSTPASRYSAKFTRLNVYV